MTGLIIDPTWHMWIVLALTAATVLSFAVERISLEMTSLVMLATLLVWFQIAPLTDGDGTSLLGPEVLFRGFANPSLLAVLALLVMGQAMIQTGALTGASNVFVRLSKRRPTLGVAGGFAAILITSAFLNNTPVVVMFIPIMQTLAIRMGWSAGRLMMPLSFAAILGGMTTTIGSSTNLLVSSALIDLGQPPFAMFAFTAIGAILALVGVAYVGLVLPRILPPRDTLAAAFTTEGKQFVAEIDVTADSPLVGTHSTAGQFRGLPDITVRLIRRSGRTLLPPFDGITLAAGDVLIVAATRAALTEALTRNAGYLLAQDPREHADAVDATRRRFERVLAEVMVAPASRMIDQSVDAIGFQRRFGCQVLGIQRRGRMARRRMGEIRLEAGDVLLISGAQESVDGLRNNPDLLLMTWATRDLPRLQRAPHAMAIFAVTVFLAALDILPISVAALTGATAMIGLGCLNLRQAIRSLDRTILLLVGSTLALGSALEQTGGARFLAMTMVEMVAGTDPVVNIAVLFLIVAIATNVMTNNATAVLFTPIALNLAYDLGVDPTIMAITVVLAANCSFATPIGYQTNLLVMGPGHYRFVDFVRGGLPLVLLMWLTFCLVAPVYFGFWNVLP